MSIEIVRGVIKNLPASNELVSVIKEVDNKYNGTLFLGYLLMATSDSIVTIDGLLITREKGLVAFVFSSEKEAKEEQDKLYYRITNTLNAYESLREGRKLAIEPVVISYLSGVNIPMSDDMYNYANALSLPTMIDNLPKFKDDYYERLVEALQRISSLKPRKKRANVKKVDSRGAIIKKIEAQIANLDQWQKKAAYEIPEGPQRIRGLAGSGKTVVLALKAAYLHAQHPDWNIAVTFYSRALSQQIRQMISDFSKEYTKDEPDWEKLQVLHSWGTLFESGIYSVASQIGHFIPATYETAREKYGREKAFAGICGEALNYIGDNNIEFFDAILIDEAQDMPTSFFKLCYKLLKQPKRLVFAYDELQNLGSSFMPSITEIFGKNETGEANVNFINTPDEARRDIVLPICYRNTPWALTLAHSLGCGIYRNEGIIQIFRDNNLWTDIGYCVESGELTAGKKVTLKRKKSSTPAFFDELLTKQDSVQVKKFNNQNDEFKWIAEQISKNITDDELDPDDILVIFTSPYFAKTEYVEFRKYLMPYNIDSNLVGVGTDRDTFKIQGSVTCAHIYRAKGNEAPMVYIVNAQLTFNGPASDMRYKRNVLFTGITRSRAWVRICGYGNNMEYLEEEANRCIDKDYSLEFVVPSKRQIEEQDSLYKNKTKREEENIRKAEDIMRKLQQMVDDGDISKQDLMQVAYSQLAFDFDAEDE